MSSVIAKTPSTFTCQIDGLKSVYVSEIAGLETFFDFETFEKANAVLERLAKDESLDCLLESPYMPPNGANYGFSVMVEDANNVHGIKSIQELIELLGKSLKTDVTMKEVPVIQIEWPKG